MPFTLPQGRTWKTVLDTQSHFNLPEVLVMGNKPQRRSNNVWLEAPRPVPTPDYVAKPRTITVLKVSN